MSFFSCSVSTVPFFSVPAMTTSKAASRSSWLTSLAALAHGPQGGLVDQVGKVRAHAAGGGLGDLVQIDVLGQPDVPGVDLEGGHDGRPGWAGRR